MGLLLTEFLSMNNPVLATWFHKVQTTKEPPKSWKLSATQERLTSMGEAAPRGCKVIIASSMALL